MVTTAPAPDMWQMSQISPVGRLILLALNQRDSLGYADLEVATGLARRTLMHHLKQLCEMGLVVRDYRAGDDGIPLPAVIRLAETSLRDIDFDEEGNYAN